MDLNIYEKLVPSYYPAYNSHENEIEDILCQTNNQEIRTLQRPIFGAPEHVTDKPQTCKLPHKDTLQLNEVFGITQSKQLGKRKELKFSSEYQMTPNLELKSKKQKTSKATVKDIQNKDEKQAREGHNLTERQRRLRITQSIQNLKELLPDSASENLNNKLAILNETVEYVKTLQKFLLQLNERNHFLEQRLSHLENVFKPPPYPHHHIPSSVIANGASIPQIIPHTPPNFHPVIHPTPSDHSNHSNHSNHHFLPPNYNSTTQSVEVSSSPLTSFFSRFFERS